MLDELLVPQFDDWRVQSPQYKFKYPWQLLHRLDLRDLTNTVFSTAQGTPIPLGDYTWTLQNFFGALDNLELTNNGLWFDFSTFVSTFHLFNATFPYIYINPNEFLGSSSEISPDIPLRFVITIDYTHAIGGLKQFGPGVCLGNKGFGNGFWLAQGIYLWKDVVWWRQEGAGVTAGFASSDDRALMIESVGDRAKCFWAPKSGIWAPDARLTDWSEVANSGMSSNVGASKSQYSFHGRRLFLGGITGTSSGTYEVNVQSIEVWYVDA